MVGMRSNKYSYSPVVCLLTYYTWKLHKPGSDCIYLLLQIWSVLITTYNHEFNHH